MGALPVRGFPRDDWRQDAAFAHAPTDLERNPALRLLTGVAGDFRAGRGAFSCAGPVMYRCVG